MQRKEIKWKEHEIKQKAEGKEDVSGPDPTAYEELPPGNFTMPYYNGGYRNYGDAVF